MCGILSIWILLCILTYYFTLKIKPDLIDFAGIKTKISDVFAFAWISEGE